MFIPDCGDIVEVDELDRHVLKELASFDSSGSTLELKIEKLPSQPTCLCGGSVHNVNRYAAITRLAHVNETIDRLHGKMGKKLGWSVRELHRLEKTLSSSWDRFCESIRPNPMAADANRNLISKRSTDLSALQKSLAEYRGKKGYRHEEALD